jgi:23S rRNA (cytidine2498-2'-O)-methyltransferase
VQPIDPRYEPISRAYYKAAEAITWSGFDMQPGDLAIEIGSAPGGACGRLLELGMRVIGIDPAEMDPRIVDHPKFRHIRARAGDLPRSEFSDAKWLLVDSNVKPAKTLVTVRNIVTHRYSHLRGLLITLKIGDYESANLVDQWSKTIQTWNPDEVQVRQLARNKCEVCFAIKM